MRAIRQLRLDRGWTQEQLAERAGLPQSQISKLERLNRSALVSTLQPIADAFEMSLDELAKRLAMEQCDAPLRLRRREARKHAIA